jgi:hypothetical protein
MSSILKVDQLQDSGGNAIITSNGSGTFTSSLPNTGITEADQWRLTADLSSNANPISSNLERVDNATFAKIGTGMSVSSGYWSFPTTGLYMIILSIYSQPNDDTLAVYIQATQNDSSYDNLTPVFGGGTSARGRTNCGTAFVNVTNTSTHKVKFELSGLGSGSIIGGNTNQNYTHFTFLRIGDSQ